MPDISADLLKQHTQMLSAMETDRSPWQKLWRELSDNYLPQRYRWLMTANEYASTRARRQYIINNTGTRAARILAAGMMNGITSPSRPWFKLRVPGLSLRDHWMLAAWLEEVERRLFNIMAGSNFYNSMAVLYLDMVVFGTAASLIYEDRESIIRCYNPPLGEYYLGQDHRLAGTLFYRKFNLKIYQYVQRWPDQRYWSQRVKIAVTTGGAALNQDVEIAHALCRNPGNVGVPARFGYYELYWEARRNQTEGQAQVLERKGFNELPGIFARWEMSATDAYGVSPAMDALGDNIDLQHTHRQKAELLEKANNPPILADVVLQNSATAFMPRGITYVPNLSNTSGARPVYTVDARFDQINIDQVSTENRLKDTFYNFLFTGITDLETVRAAAEIDARESEKLILLGGVLERFESEGLDPAIKRIYSIAERANLLPDIPAQYAGVEIEIQYVSVLSLAQRAAGTAPTERFLQVLGNLAAIRPEALNIPKFDKMLINYALDIGVRQSELNSEEEIAKLNAPAEEAAQTQLGTEAVESGAKSAELLSRTNVGGGQSALQMMLRGAGAV